MELNKQFFSEDEFIEYKNHPDEVTFQTTVQRFDIWRSLFRYRYYVLSFGNDSTERVWIDYENIGLFERRLDIIKLSYIDKLSHITIFPSPTKLHQTTLRIQNGLGKTHKKLVIHMYPTTSNFLIQGKCCRDWISYEFKSLCNIVNSMQQSGFMLSDEKVFNVAPYTLSNLSLSEYVVKMNSSCEQSNAIQNCESTSEKESNASNSENVSDNSNMIHQKTSFIEEDMTTTNMENISVDISEMSKCEVNLLKMTESNLSLSNISWEDSFSETKCKCIVDSVTHNNVSTNRENEKDKSDDVKTDSETEVSFSPSIHSTNENKYESDKNDKHNEIHEHSFDETPQSLNEKCLHKIINNDSFTSRLKDLLIQKFQSEMEELKIQSKNELKPLLMEIKSLKEDLVFTNKKLSKANDEINRLSDTISDQKKKINELKQNTKDLHKTKQKVEDHEDRLSFLGREIDDISYRITKRQHQQIQNNIENKAQQTQTDTISQASAPSPKYGQSSITDDLPHNINKQDHDYQLPEYTYKSQHDDTNYVPKCLLIGDSIIKDIAGRKMETDDLPVWHKISISGCKTNDLTTRFKSVQANPDLSQVILHVGVNDCKEKIIQHKDWHDMITETKKAFPFAEIVCSSILPTKSNPEINQRVKESNENLSNLCKNQNIKFIDHWKSFRTINDKPKKALYTEHENVHLSHTGTKVLARNLKYPEIDWVERKKEQYETKHRMNEKGLSNNLYDPHNPAIQNHEHSEAISKLQKSYEQQHILLQQRYKKQEEMYQNQLLQKQHQFHQLQQQHQTQLQQMQQQVHLYHRSVQQNNMQSSPDPSQQNPINEQEAKKLQMLQNINMFLQNLM